MRVYVSYPQAVLLIRARVDKDGISHDDVFAVARDPVRLETLRIFIRVEEIGAIARGATTQLDVLLGDHLDASRERGAILKTSSQPRRYGVRRRVPALGPLLQHLRSLARLLHRRLRLSRLSSRLVHHLHQRFPRLGPSLELVPRVSLGVYIKLSRASQLSPQRLTRRRRRIRALPLRPRVSTRRFQRLPRLCSALAVSVARRA